MTETLEFELPEAGTTGRTYEPPKRGGKVAERVSVPIAPDGSVDISSMRDDIRSRFESAVRHPKTKALLFPETAELDFSDSDIRSLFGTISMLETAIARIVLKAPGDIAKKSFEWTDSQLALITPSTKAVLARYLPSQLQAHKDLSVFIMVFLTVTREQFANCLVVTAQMKALQSRSARPNGVVAAENNESATQ